MSALSFRRFARDASAIAATEFALIVPLASFALLAEFDTYRYVMATQRVEIVAESVAQMVASASASTSANTTGDGVISDSDLNFFGNSAYFLYPDVLTSPAVQKGSAWWQAIEIDIAGLQMVQQPGGNYTAKTVWHVLNSIGPNNRQCNTTYTFVSDASVPSPTTLPTDVMGPNSLIVVDVRTTFQPTFGASFLSSISIVRSVYMTPRNVPFVEYQGNNSIAMGC